MHLTEILDKELARFGDAPLHIFETGTIRGNNEASRIGDGWSTLYFAERTKRLGGTFASIDLETAVAAAVLEVRGLQGSCNLYRDHSINCLSRMLQAAQGPTWDVALLDSDNDAQLIYHEFLMARRLVRTNGLILIDDVDVPPPGRKRSGALKGDIVLPEIVRLGLSHRLTEREGWNGYRTGVLAIDV